MSQSDVLTKFAEINHEKMNEIKKFLEDFNIYLFNFIKYLRSVLSRYYITRIDTIKDTLDKFEDITTFEKHEEVLESNLFEFVMSFVSSLEPVKSSFKVDNKINVNVFDKDFYNSLEGITGKGTFIPGCILDFISLWSDPEVSDQIKKKIVTYLMVINEKGIILVNATNSLQELAESTKNNMLSDIALSKAKDIISDTLGDDENKTKFLSFFDVVGGHFKDNNINPVSIMTDLMAGKLDKINSVANAIQENMGELDITPDDFKSTFNTIAGGISDTEEFRSLPEGAYQNTMNILNSIKGSNEGELDTEEKEDNEGETTDTNAE